MQDKSAPVSDRNIIQTIRSVRGNSVCADCDSPSMIPRFLCLVLVRYVNTFVMAAACFLLLLSKCLLIIAF